MRIDEDTTVALLDYDGFVCKAWYAALSSGDMDIAIRILNDLTEAAIKKAYEFDFDNYNTEGVRVIKVLSGHSWKKELYTDYKAHRKKDPYILELRKWVKENVPDIVIIEPLEADEVITVIHQEIPENTIIFSDDKDLHRIANLYCKVNIDESIQYNGSDDLYYEQYLTGDKEDNVKGIPKVGYKTAEKMLEENGFNFKGVIKSYYQKGISKEECIKQLVLINPMMKSLNAYPELFTELTERVLSKREFNKAPELTLGAFMSISAAVNYFYNEFKKEEEQTNERKEK